MTVPVNQDVLDAFAEQRRRRAEEHRQLRAMVLDEVCANPVPLTAQDVMTLVNSAHSLNYSLSTYRDILAELTEYHKVIARKETPEEALVRGGGKMPKATRPLLYTDPMYGTVPCRTRLPKGIMPHKSLDDRVIEELSRRYVDGTSSNRPRTIGRLADHLGVDKKELKPVLARLVRQGKLYENASSYFIAGRQRTHKPEPTPTQITPTGTVVEVQGATEEQKMPQRFFETRPSNDKVDELVRQVVTAASVLGSLATADTDALEQRVRQLEEENAQLKAKLLQVQNLFKP